MDAGNSALSAKVRRRITAWCLLTLAMLLLSVRLLQLLPYMPDAYPTYASEVLPGTPPLSASDIQRLEGTLHGPSASVRFAVIMAAQLALWGLMLLTARKMPESAAARAGFITGTVLLVTQLGSSAMLSSDVYAYITQSRTLALYHVNPSSQQTVLPKDDPYLAPLGSYIPSQYGPLWSLLGAALARVGGEHVGLTVLLFRITAILGALMTTGVLWRFAKEICPQRAGIAVVFFLCNPLVIFEMGCGGHNDCWMVAPMLAGVIWAVRGNLLVSAAFFAAAALVKAPAAVIGGFCVLTLLKLLPGWRERLRHGAVAVFLSLVLAAAAFGSVRVLASKDTAVRGGFSTLAAAVRQSLLGTYYINSLHEIAFRIGRRLGGEDAQLASADIFFQGWWLKSKTAATLYRSPATNATAISLKPGELVLVAAPQMSDQWAYVYDPLAHQHGFVRSVDVEETSEQLDTQNDPALADLSLPLGQRALSVRVSLTIRLVTWLVFVAAFFWLVCHTRNTAELPVKCLILLVLALYLIASWFWPWYVLWALPLAAVTQARKSNATIGTSSECGSRRKEAQTKPDQLQQPKMEPPYVGCYNIHQISEPGAVARTLTIQLSFTVLSLYALSDSAWTYSWRAAFVFGLPLLGAALVHLIVRATRDRSVR
jgi:hypothetical protein